MALLSGLHTSTGILERKETGGGLPRSKTLEISTRASIANDASRRESHCDVDFATRGVCMPISSESSEGSNCAAIEAWGAWFRIELYLEKMLGRNYLTRFLD